MKKALLIAIFALMIQPLAVSMNEQYMDRKKEMLLFGALQNDGLEKLQNYMSIWGIDSNYTFRHFAQFKGRSLLANAVGAKAKKITKYLLDEGADINAQDPFGFTALHYTVLTNQLPFAKLLVSKGAKLNIKAGRSAKQFSNKTPAEMNPLSVVGKYLQIVAEKKSTRPSKKMDSEKELRLLEAIESNNTTIFGGLMSGDWGIGPNYVFQHGRGLKGKSLLVLAVEENVPKIFNYLVNVVKDVNKLTEDGKKQTALHYAAMTGNADIGKKLLEKGGNKDLEDAYGQTPLGIAKENHKTSFVAMLEGREEPIMPERFGEGGLIGGEWVTFPEGENFIPQFPKFLKGYTVWKDTIILVEDENSIYKHDPREMIPTSVGEYPNRIPVSATEIFRFIKMDAADKIKKELIEAYKKHEQGSGETIERFERTISMPVESEKFVPRFPNFVHGYTVRDRDIYRLDERGVYRMRDSINTYEGSFPYKVPYSVLFSKSFEPAVLESDEWKREMIEAYKRHLQKKQ